MIQKILRWPEACKIYPRIDSGGESFYNNNEEKNVFWRDFYGRLLQQMRQAAAGERRLLL